ncbi:alpha/beta fold hydrolase [Gordonia sp. CPCC 205515]|uniref:alpha/beta fold hydrolase n=1 Tax=Gordonia sp. CPCC 205515 TaxID=3140791 RepID=UPI003AF36E6F
MTAEPWLDEVDDLVSARVVEVDGVPMSGLIAEADDPRGIIVAIHGGAARATYFDCPGHPANSLLRLAQSLGYTAIAIDRPGYGASRPHAEHMDAARRVELAYGAVDALVAGRATGAGLFLWAHSVGCELTIRMAADGARGPHLLGLELSGTGLERQAAAHAILGNHERNAPAAGVRQLLWEPAGLYPADVIGGASIASKTPPFEGSAVRAWPRETFPSHAPAVSVPVHFTAAEHERVWRHDSTALADIAELFSSSPRVVVDEFVGGGHNLSLGHLARSYHLRVLSFVEYCVARRTLPDLPIP